jgi:hypothetical protein
LLVAVLALPGAWLTDFSTAVQPRPGATYGPAGALPWLHVAHPAGQRAFIADPEGRQVILRGAVTGALVDYWSGTDPADPRPAAHYPIDPTAFDGTCPGNSATIVQPPLCRADLAEMHALGFDVLRLALSWSLLEPRPGVYDKVYLDRVAQVVGWASQEGVYVILDMHENAWSRYLGRPVPPPWPGGSPTALNTLSGAPDWATLTDFWPSQVYLGQRELNPAVFAAFTSFWLNRRVPGPMGAAPGGGLQDHYIGALAALAKRFRDNSAVVGYGLFNEPWPGFAPSPLFEDLLLFPFYRRVIDALAGAQDGLPCPASTPAVAACGYPDLGIHDRGHLFFFEPNHLREQTDFTTSVPLPFSSSPNLVYSIHTYTHQFTLDALLGLGWNSGYPPGGFGLSFASAEGEARAMRAALFVSEFGGDPGQDTLLAGQLRQQEVHVVGSTVWPWKENCTLTATWGVYAGVYDGLPDQRCAYDRPRGEPDAGPKAASGCLRPDRERLLARVWPLALSPSSGVSFMYDPWTGAFHLQATTSVRDHRPSPETLVFVPPEVRGEATVSGGATLAATDLAADGSRLLHVQPQGGTYGVVVAPASLALAACPSNR